MLKRQTPELENGKWMPSEKLSDPTPKIDSRKATRRKSKKLRKVEGRRVGC